MTSDAIDLWNDEATTFDDEPDHGLADPRVRQVWAELLRELVPPAPVRVADLGCGTGSLSVLLAEQGHRVCGIDFAAAMVDRARAKAERLGVDVDLAVGDASDPQLAPRSFDVVLSRHVLWALPDPRAGLRRWVDLLAPGGRLVLVEGSWTTGAGLTAEETTALLDPRLVLREVRHLPDPTYWGKEISDERYVVVADLAD